MFFPLIFALRKMKATIASRALYLFRFNTCLTRFNFDFSLFQLFLFCLFFFFFCSLFRHLLLFEVTVICVGCIVYAALLEIEGLSSQAAFHREPALISVNSCSGHE